MTQREGVRIAVLVSGHGRGSNMQALIDACKEGRIRGTVVVVIGTRADAPAIARARQSGVPTVVVRPGTDDADYGRRLLSVLTRFDVNLVCLAGYMRLLPANVVEAFRWRILNIHPALLPKFGGKGMYGERVHRAVIEAGETVSGCTVHFVDDQYDHGPILMQKQVPVLPDDTPETLAARVLPEEHRTYVQAVALVADGCVHIEDHKVILRNPSDREVTACE